MGKEKGIRGWYSIPSGTPKSDDPEFWQILKQPPAQPMPDFTVSIQKVNVKAHPRKLTATWSVETIADLENAYGIEEPVKPVPGEPEFWTILKTPPKRKKSLSEEIGDELAKQIQQEIDKEILEALTKEATKTAIIK
jgi:hypothetical protein